MLTKSVKRMGALHMLGALIGMIFIGILAACQQIELTTFNQKEAASISTVTEVRKQTLSLLQAHKITVADAENVQKQADNAMEAIKLAQQLHNVNASAGSDKLQTAVVVLDTLSTYLRLKGDTK
jgi:predicted kinase